MSDEFDDLKALLQAAPPVPDPDAKARDIALAMKNFDRHQETADQARSMSDRPSRAGVLTGVRAMLANLTSRRALAATTSVAALCLGAFIIIPALDRDGLRLQPDGTLEGPVIGSVPATPATPGESSSLAAATLERERASELGRTVDQPAAPEPQSLPLSRDVVAQTEDFRAEKKDEDTADLELREEAAPMVDALASVAPAPAPVAKTTAEMAGQRSNALATGITGGFVAQDSAADMLAVPQPEPNTEAFSNEPPSKIKTVATEPVSTFSIDVDTASYALVRSSLMAGYLPPAEAVRIEEMVNYFPYGYAGPEAGEAPFRPSVTVVAAPWNDGKKLVHIAIQGRLPALAERPPLNLVFLIDTSGSMQDANKLPLLKQSFRLMLGQLRPEDQVAIVTYAGSAGQVLEATPARESAKIMAALDRLDAGGSTAGQAGLLQAYAVAEGMAEDGEVTRVILATDGDFNVGISDPDQLKSFIEGKRKSGTYLSVLGFGRGNVDDAVMQSLAQNGNGTAAYIDTLSEAQKVLVDQLSGALFPIANDVKIQMEFNPAVIAEYRLIGYETRALAREDFNNDKVDAGDIGAGHSVTAIYEVTPVGSPAVQIDPLRYAAGEAAPEAASDNMELGFLKLRYKEPGAATSQLIEIPVSPEPGQASESARFAIAMAGFGQLLTGAEYLGDWGWDEAIALANGAKGADEFGYRAEAVQIMRLAQSLQQ